MSFDPYQPPRSDVTTAPPGGRVNRYYRMLNWLYAGVMAVGFVFLVRGGSLEADVSTLVTLAMFLAPVAGYVFATSDRLGGYRVWRYAHLAFAGVIILMVIDDMGKGKPIHGVVWFIVLANVSSLTANEYFRRKRLRVAPQASDVTSVDM